MVLLKEREEIVRKHYCNVSVHFGSLRSTFMRPTKYAENLALARTFETFQMDVCCFQTCVENSALVRTALHLSITVDQSVVVGSSYLCMRPLIAALRRKKIVLTKVISITPKDVIYGINGRWLWFQHPILQRWNGISDAGFLSSTDLTDSHRLIQVCSDSRLFLANHIYCHIMQHPLTLHLPSSDWDWPHCHWSMVIWINWGSPVIHVYIYGLGWCHGLCPLFSPPCRGHTSTKATCTAQVILDDSHQISVRIEKFGAILISTKCTLCEQTLRADKRSPTSRSNYHQVLLAMHTSETRVILDFISSVECLQIRPAPGCNLQ